ncbi:MAG: DUF2281 domain-containing protein [Planctomycetes bacterium]|nr:DUF2281 domain-containing protein [Planctomycetota bacterium]MBM4080311.1 DUF2281 domain-containing protein [Planctomycetota bacterium]MBM4086557.1 DUF2281 domain-containing protein [Planctomycetota bacterium]
MEADSIVREVASLPPEARKQVRDFVAFLKARYRPQRPAGKTRRVELADEPFIGMWRDREDMRDSSGWVRGLRKREWERRG